MIAACHKTALKKKKSCICAGLNLMAQVRHFCQCSQHNSNPTKYGIKENNRAIVLASMHGTVRAVKTMQTSICSGLVAQKQDGRKQWLNVFVSISQKLIAGYLHSRDHTRCSMLNGENHIVIKDIVIKGSGSVLGSRRYCSIPLSVKGLLWAVVLSSRPCLLAQNYTYFCAPRGLVLNCCFQS